MTDECKTVRCSREADIVRIVADLENIHAEHKENKEGIASVATDVRSLRLIRFGNGKIGMAETLRIIQADLESIKTRMEARRKKWDARSWSVAILCATLVITQVVGPLVRHKMGW